MALLFSHLAMSATFIYHLCIVRAISCVHVQVNSMLNKNTLGVKKVRGQSEAALQIGMCDQKL